MLRKGKSGRQRPPGEVHHGRHARLGRQTYGRLPPEGGAGLRAVHAERPGISAQHHPAWRRPARRGQQPISGIIKYLTQSTWSHAALYVGPIDGAREEDGEPHVLIEANVGEGVTSAPLSKYFTY